MLVLLIVSTLGAASTSAAPTPLDETGDRDSDEYRVHPDLRGATGPTEVVVHFEPADAAPAPVEGPVRSTLEANGDRQQRPLLEYAADEPDATVRHRFRLVNAVVLEVNASTPVLDRIADVETVDRVSPNAEVTSTADAGADPSTSRADAAALRSGTEGTTYGLDVVNATEAWEAYGDRGSGATVAVVDTGVDPSHRDVDLGPESPGRSTDAERWAEFDYYGERVEESTPHDATGHGTHVAGTVAGDDASGRWIGVAPEADLLAAKAVDEDGRGTIAGTVAAIEWAVEQDADVVALSLGVDGQHAALIDAVRNAEAAGTLVVGAAGRHGAGRSAAPGNVYEAVSVGATDRSGDVLPSSGGEVIDVERAWGEAAPEDWPQTYVTPDLVAPGESVYSAARGGGYARRNGTSMATPHAAGVAALLYSALDDPAPSVVRRAMEASARVPAGAPDEPDRRYGAGVVDARAAVTYARENAVRGRVVSDGSPVEGATVRADSGVGVRTGPDGTFDLVLQSGTHDLTVRGFGVPEQTHTVTVSDGSPEDPRIDVEETSAARIAAEQPDVVEAGEPIIAELAVANVDAIRVSLDGTYEPSDAALRVEGRSGRFGDRIPVGDRDALTVRVDTAADATGTVGLELSFPAAGDPVELASGPTAVVERVRDVAVVGSEARHAGTLATTLDRRLPTRYRTEPVTASNATARMDGFDVAVVHRVDAGAAEPLVTSATDHGVGLLLLEQWGEDSNAISRVANATGWPARVEQREGGTPPVRLRPETEHRIHDGVGSTGEEYAIHEGRFADRVWFEGATGATVVASVGGDQQAPGPALAVAEERNTVLAASFGRSRYVPEDAHTNVSRAILANAVRYLAESHRTTQAEMAAAWNATDAGTAGPSGPAPAADSGPGNDAASWPEWGSWILVGLIVVLLCTAAAGRR